jgi:hypothetical protein
LSRKSLFYGVDEIFSGYQQRYFCKKLPNFQGSSLSLSCLVMGTDTFPETSVIFYHSKHLKSQKILSAFIAVKSSDLESLSIELNSKYKKSFMDYTSIAT